MGQRNSSLWYEVRHFRLTASLFGTIVRRKPGTPPEKLVMCILQQNRFTSATTEWGVQQEYAAIDAYVKYKQSQGNCAINVSACGIYICKSHPFLGASPDGCVYDPSSLTEPFGFLEIKCPYTHRNVTQMEATLTTGFCSIKEVSADPTVHSYVSMRIIPTMHRCRVKWLSGEESVVILFYSQ